MPSTILPPPVSKPNAVGSRHRPVASPRPPEPQSQVSRGEDEELGRDASNAEWKTLLETYHPRNLRIDNIDWSALLWIVAMHLGCLAAPFFFSWSALGAFLVMHWLACSVGICLGFHRYLTHRSLNLAPPAKFFVLLCSSMAGQGSPLTWTAVHRLHHGRSDQDGDPHSPRDGAWWSHILWLFVRHPKQDLEALFRRYVPDRAADPMVQFFECTWSLWMVAPAAILYLAGGWPFVLWGMCVRMTVAYHSTWFVNSATHLWGYRSYETGDDSRNLWWVALVSYGEGWHNNHHAHPTLAPAGHRWWEVDPTWWVIRTLRFCRLASDVQDRIPAAKAY